MIFSPFSALAGGVGMEEFLGFEAFCSFIGGHIVKRLTFLKSQTTHVELFKWFFVLFCFEKFKQI